MNEETLREMAQIGVASVVQEIIGNVACADNLVDMEAWDEKQDIREHLREATALLEVLSKALAL